MKLRHKPFMQYCAMYYYPMLMCKQEKKPTHVCTTQPCPDYQSYQHEIDSVHYYNIMSNVLLLHDTKNLISPNWVVIKSTLFHSMSFSMITTHKAQV